MSIVEVIDDFNLILPFTVTSMIMYLYGILRLG